MTIPFLCVFLAFLLTMAPKLIFSVAMARQPGGYDNNHPRDQQAALAGWGRRAHAAHLNTIEAFPPFAAAVLVCHLAHGDPTWAARLAVAFVVARMIYPILYMADLATLRSTVWGIGYLCTGALFVLPWLAHT